MASFDELLKRYHELERAAAAATAPAVRERLERLRNQALSQAEAAANNPEEGDVLASQAEPIPYEPPGARDRPPAVGPTPGRGMRGDRPYASASATEPLQPGAPGYETQPTAERVREGFVADPGFNVAGTGEVAPAQESFQAPSSTPSAAPEATTPFPSMSDADMRALQSRGGGRGGIGLRGALVEAGAAGANARAATQTQYQALRNVSAQDQQAGAAEGRAIGAALTELRAADANHQERLNVHVTEARRIMDESMRATEDFKRTASEGTLLTSLGETGNKIGVALSVALGAIGGGLSKTGGNVALDILKLRIDGDLRDRAERLRAKGTVLDQLDRLLVRNMDLMGNEEAARNATRAALFDGLKLEVNRINALSGGERSKLATEAVIAGMDAEIARSREASANAVMQQKLRAAARGGKSELELYKERLEIREKELGVLEKAQKLSPGASLDSDLGSEEGKRMADRKRALHNLVEPFDAALSAGQQLLGTLGVPDRFTRAQAAAADWLPGADIGLSSKQHAQLGALFELTKAKARANNPGPLSNQDLELAWKRELRQGIGASDDDIKFQVKQGLEISELGKKRALATDAPAAVQLMRDRAKAGITSTPSYGDVPSYSRGQVGR